MTFALLALVAYLWAFGFFIIYVLDEGPWFWDGKDIAIAAAWPVTFPVLIAATIYEDELAPRIKRAHRKAKSKASELYNWVTGRD